MRNSIAAILEMPKMLIGAKSQFFVWVCVCGGVCVQWMCRGVLIKSNTDTALTRAFKPAGRMWLARQFCVSREIKYCHRPVFAQLMK